MRRIVPIFVIAVITVAMYFGLPDFACAAEKTADTAADKSDGPKALPPAERVVVMYFHRTKRCPTCLKMGGYTEEAVKTGFAKQLKEKNVEFHYIDFQDKKNEKLTKGYQVGGPTLIVAKIKDNKVTEVKNLKEMWVKVSDKDAFVKYVRENVTAFLPKPKVEKTASK
jgi:hypothetical protein